MPIILTFATAAGAVLAMRLLKREWTRVNREIDAAEAAPARHHPAPRSLDRQSTARD